MNKKFYETQLAKLNRAHTERKVKLANEAGYATPKEYKEKLLEIIADLPDDAIITQATKPIIHNVHILDRSTSMGSWNSSIPSKLDMALEGINKEIEELKKDTTVEYFQTIVDFGNQSNCSIDKVPIQEVNFFNISVKGSTALYQTIGETLEKLKNSQVTEKVLVKIFTDGEENCSIGKYRDSTVLARLIKECEERGFTIVFSGTNRDVQSIMQSLSIHESNTLSHDNTSRGVADSFERSLNATSGYTTNVKAGKDVKKGFYKGVKKS